MVRLLCTVVSILLVGTVRVAAPLPGGNNVVAIAPNGAVAEFVSVGSGGLHGPETSAVHDGSLFVMSTYTAKILRYSLSDGQFQSVFVDGQSAGLYSGVGLCFASTGFLLVSNLVLSNVLRFGLDGKFVDVFIASGKGDLQLPESIYEGPGPDRRLWVVSFNNSKVLRYDIANGNFIDAFVDDHNRGALLYPSALAFGPAARASARYDVFVSSYFPGAVYRFDGATGEARGAFVKPNSGGLQFAGGIVFSSRYLFVVNTTSVLSYNAASGDFVGVAVKLAQANLAYPMFLSLDPATGRVFVTSCTTAACTPEPPRPMRPRAVL